MEGDDEAVGLMPIHYTNALASNVAVLQFPLLTRPLEVPPSAAASGKRIKARIKPNVRKLEVHVPADVRPEVWNKEQAAILGAARLEDDKEKNQESKVKQREGEQPRLSEVRMSSEEIPRAGTYMLGVVRNGTSSPLLFVLYLIKSQGRLSLHPIAEMHQLRPTLTYMDHLSRKKGGRGGDDSGSEDDGPPQDPDEVAAEVTKKEKPEPQAKEVQVSVRKSTPDEKNVLGGLSVQRRELLSHIRAEEDDPWEELVYYDGAVRIHVVGRICPLTCLCSQMNLVTLLNRCSRRRSKSCRHLTTCRCLFGGNHKTQLVIQQSTPVLVVLGGEPSSQR